MARSNIFAVYTTNQDIRQYMADHRVSQRALAREMGIGVAKVNKMLQAELSQKDKEDLLHHIDAIVEDRKAEAEEPAVEAEEVVETAQEQETTATCDGSSSTKFQVGDRVKIPSKENKVGTVGDIWASLTQGKVMYAVDIEGHIRGLYSEEQLEPAPLPIEYSWGAHIDGNVAVVTMIAKQGEKEWTYARGHAHIIHDGEVGMAQAISYAARRMFESLDTKQDKQIYFKDRRDGK